MEEEKNPQIAQEETKNHKLKNNNTLNTIICIILSILIILQVFIWIISLYKKNNTLNIFGNLPYISKYSDNIYGIEKGDLDITNKEDIFKNKIVSEYKDKLDTIIITGNEYEIIRSYKDYSAENIFNIKLKQIGNFILFFREIYMVIVVAIVVILAYIIICILRTRKSNYFDKEYKRIRTIKDILVFLFIIVTYISIFSIGKIYDARAYAMEHYDDSFQDDIIQNDANKNNTTDDNNNQSNGLGYPSNNEEINLEFFVTEDNQSWNQLKSLDIFKDEFSDSKKIYPGLTGTYDFKIENQSEYNLTYNISFDEENPYSVNLKYKLIKNGRYINDDYISANRLKEQSFISSNTTDTYALEWKWIDSPNDTYIGENAENVNYKLKISVQCTLE